MRLLDNKGLTLVELMVVVAITSIFLGAVISAYQVQVRSKNTQEAITDMNTTARAAMEIITHELRTAGCDPDGVAGAGIVNAGANTITFTMDIGNTAGTSFQPDGLLDGPNEQVRYALTGGGDLGRATGAAGVLQPLAQNVDAIDFVYLDQDDNVTATLADIRTIQVTMVARSGQAAGGFMRAYTDTTVYTNQQGTVILPAQNDAFRRLLLTTTVNCRNLGIF